MKTLSVKKFVTGFVMIVYGAIGATDVSSGVEEDTAGAAGIIIESKGR